MYVIDALEVSAIRYRLRHPVADAAINDLRGDAWPGVTDLDWTSILAHSLGWVTAHENGRLVGFVNVAWDEGLHAFLLDRVVHPSFRHQGIGSALVRRAVGLARDAGAEWVHVDFDPELGPFYGACGFRPTPAGLIELRTD